MTGYCVVTTELARARIFTLEASEQPELESSPYLVERKSLVNPQHKAKESDVWTDTRRGANREHQSAQRGAQTTGTPHHNYDEHRENNERKANTQFAKELVADLKDLISREKLDHVVLCAEKQMLGVLRPELDALLKDKVKLTEIGKNLTNLTPRELHARLADDELLPPQKRAGPSVLGA